MAHFMSNENNDDNDNCETTIQNVSKKETRVGKPYLFLILCLKFLEFNFCILLKLSLKLAKQVQHPNIQVMFVSVF